MVPHGLIFGEYFCEIKTINRINSNLRSECFDLCQLNVHEKIELKEKHL